MCRIRSQRVLQEECLQKRVEGRLCPYQAGEKGSLKLSLCQVHASNSMLPILHNRSAEPVAAGDLRLPLLRWGELELQAKG